MNWLSIFSHVTPTSNATGRQLTILALTTLCGIGCVAYIMVVRGSNEKKKKLRKWQNNSQLESEIILHLKEAKGAMAKKTENQQSIQTQALDDLMVAMDQLEHLLTCINKMEELSFNIEYVTSVQMKLISLTEMLDDLSDKKNQKLLKGSREQKIKEKEHQLISAGSEKHIVEGHHYDDDLDVQSSSSDDSFVSAAESVPEELFSGKNVDFDEEARGLVVQYGHLEFYKEGIEEYQNRGVDVRTLRTEMLGCENDADFRVKVYCIRNAFNELLQDNQWKNWLLETGYDMLADFMTIAGKKSFEFERDFKNLIEYCQNERNWIEIEEELRSRGVCSMCFYDIVLDFIIMDSFDDLANPPYALTSVIQNGWISNSIKESALSAAVWSLLTAKIRMLQNPNAFMVKFYQLSQHITPVLAWGFLGPETKLKNACRSFKALLLGFLQDIFSLDRCNYSSKKTLADDIISNAKQRLLQKEDF